ncbi:MAG TPA: hypothetical protein VFS00_07180, partial [Polyangiaceae bacterium]|nr:hypothetical protein [Polyangiaceae bacterium]
MPERCWKIDHDPLKNRVIVRYWGVTPTPSLLTSMDELREAIPATRPILVIDVRELEGHNADGRPLWQAFLKEQKENISAVYVVSPLAMAATRMVATVIGLAVGLRLRLVESLREVPLGRIYRATPSRAVPLGRIYRATPSRRLPSGDVANRRRCAPAAARARTRRE